LRQYVQRYSSSSYAAFEDILKFFQTKRESDLIKTFDFERIVALNFTLMARTYGRQCFDANVRETDDEDFRRKHFAGLIVSLSELRRPDDHELSTGQKKGTSSNATDKQSLVGPKDWTYRHSAIGYTESIWSSLKEIQDLKASPFLPKDMQVLLATFETAVRKNINIVGDVLTECSRKMSILYPTPESLADCRPGWVWNEFNHRAQSLQPLAEQIVTFINRHLKIEELVR
jgi:hypothetical protein